MTFSEVGLFSASTILLISFILLLIIFFCSMTKYLFIPVMIHENQDLFSSDTRVWSTESVLWIMTPGKTSKEWQTFSYRRQHFAFSPKAHIPHLPLTLLSQNHRNNNLSFSSQSYWYDLYIILYLLKQHDYLLLLIIIWYYILHLCPCNMTALPSDRIFMLVKQMEMSCWPPCNTSPHWPLIP